MGRLSFRWTPSLYITMEDELMLQQEPLKHYHCPTLLPMADIANQFSQLLPTHLSGSAIPGLDQKMFLIWELKA